MSSYWGLHTAAEVPQFGHQLPHVGPMEGADWENNDGIVDNEWADGGCAHLALAFKNRWPDLKIGAEIGHRGGEDQVYHAWVHDGRNAHDVYGTHKNDPEANAVGDGEIDLDVDPQRLADLQGVKWSPDEPWADRRVLRASGEIDRHWLGSDPYTHTASTDGIRYAHIVDADDSYYQRPDPRHYDEESYPDIVRSRTLLDIEPKHFDMPADEAFDYGWSHDSVNNNDPRQWSEFEGFNNHVRDHGIQRPLSIVTDGESAYLEDGHHRVQKAVELGHDHVPVRVTKGKVPPHRARPIGESLRSWITASTDGIRYAQVVEADVAEDLRRLAMPSTNLVRWRTAAPVDRNLAHRLFMEFHQWAKNEGSSIVPSNWPPLGHWGSIEAFLRDRYPASHRGLEMGSEEAGTILDGHDPMPYMVDSGMDTRPYETGPDAEAKHGYDPKEIAAGMLLLHNGAHSGRGRDVESADWERLHDIARKRTQMQRDYERRQQTARLAMPQPLPKGVYFRYHPELMWSPGVTAHLPGGKQVGSLEWYDDDHVMVDLGTRKPGEIDRIGVHPEHQGHSIATSMFDFAKQYEPRLHHSEELTDDGRGWSAYEQARNARLAMAWQNWAPHIQHAYESPEGFPFSVGKYHITHGDGAESSLSYLHRPERKLLQVQMLGTEEPHQRQGIAEAFLRRLHADYPDHRIDPNGMTDDGQAFHDRMLDKEPEARNVLAGRNGDLPPMTFEPFNTMWSNGIMARHAEDGRPLAHLHWYPDGEIETIRVHPEMRGRDIGKHILMHAATHPETYEAEGGIKPSNNLTPDGRAFARSLGHDPSDEEITPAEGEHQWAWKAVQHYVPMHIPYTGQNEDEMSRYLDKPWTPTKTAAAGDGWPVWWRGRQRPAVPFDKRWHPNHPQHVPAPWDH